MQVKNRARRSSAIIALALSASFVVGSFAAATPASATTSSEEKMAYYINKSRVRRDLGSLKLSQSLSDKARAHSRQMRDKGSIFHTKNLSYTLRNYSWTIAGENVGVGPTMWKLHLAFMASPGHRANILHKKYRRMGVGVAWDGPVAYITVMFMDYA